MHGIVREGQCIRATNDAVVEFYKRLEYEVEDRISFGKTLGARGKPPPE